MIRFFVMLIFWLLLVSSGVNIDLYMEKKNNVLFSILILYLHLHCASQSDFTLA